MIMEERAERETSHKIGLTEESRKQKESKEEQKESKRLQKLGQSR